MLNSLECGDDFTTMHLHVDAIEVDMNEAFAQSTAGALHGQGGEPAGCVALHRAMRTVRGRRPDRLREEVTAVPFEGRRLVLLTVAVVRRQHSGPASPARVGLGPPRRRLL